MSTLIVYASKSGTAKECADILAQKLDHSQAYGAANAPAPDEWDTVVLGSGVRMEKAYKPLLKYMTKHAETLKTKRVAIYLCNGDLDSFVPSLEKSIPASLREHALATVCLGGRPPFSKKPGQEWLQSDQMDALVRAVDGK
ncbi:hypothetical protein LJC49_03110 [Ruminococcaceae bacterium OttesenSCG-928-I18]|nr:hypothetical protein [Ruminococcaceae bacterium OttesenSCG-928-I18]